MHLPKTQRNIRLWLEKDGLTSAEDKVPTRTPKTFRQLSAEYNLSIPRLVIIIQRERKKHGRI